MKLELEITRVQDARFGTGTGVADGVLTVDKQELEALLSQDGRFSRVELQLASPGESCRIVQVFDVVEPRAKAPGQGEDFPGVLGKMSIAGSGRTRVLRGAAVVVTDQLASVEMGSIIDMRGTAAALSPYAATQNVILLAFPADGVGLHEYRLSLKLAALKTAVYLARAALGLPPDETEVYELSLEGEGAGNAGHLPRVAYIYQIHSHQFPTGRDEPVLYGDNIRKLVPIILHPNEVLDGAIVRAFWGRGYETYAIQNHAMITELYRRHGRELQFAGVVGAAAHFTEPERERSAAMAAHLAKRILGAEAAVLTKIGGGAPHVDLARTGERCEELGIKTVLVVENTGEGEAGGQVIFDSPTADAMVNVGCASAPLNLPAMDRLVGALPRQITQTPARERVITPNFLCGVMNQLGGSRLQSVLY